MRVLNKLYWPQSVEISESKWKAAESWCCANLKSENWRTYSKYDPSWQNYDCIFYFKKSQDATMFILRWS